MPEIRAKMRLMLVMTWISLLLGKEGVSALTCYYQVGHDRSSEGNCTGATHCFMRVIYEADRDPFVDYNCMSDSLEFINPSAFCNQTYSDDRTELHILCCSSYDYCNRDLSIPPREPGPSSSVTLTPTHSPTPEKQENKISLWLLLIVTIIPTVFILNLILCIVLGVQLRRYHTIRKQEQRQSEVRSTGSDQIQFVNST